MEEAPHLLSLTAVEEVEEEVVKTPDQEVEEAEIG